MMVSRWVLFGDKKSRVTLTDPSLVSPSGSEIRIVGLPIPAMLAPFVSMFVTQALVPQASMVGTWEFLWSASHMLHVVGPFFGSLQWHCDVYWYISVV